MLKKKKSLNRIILETRIKNIALSCAYLLFVLVVAFVFDKFAEFLIFMLTYSTIRAEFSKQIHGSDFTDSATKGIKYCRIITTIVQLISILFLIKINLSKYANISLAVGLGILNFLAKDYLEHIRNKVIFYKGMKECELPKDLVGIEREVMCQYYVKRYQLGKIAINLGYSIENIKRIKKKVALFYSK